MIKMVILNVLIKEDVEDWKASPKGAGLLFG